MKKLLTLSLLSFLPLTAHADTFAGIYAGVQYWDMEATGAFGGSDGLQTFNLKDESKASYWVAFEHFIPLVPNIKLRRNQLDTLGNAELESLEFGGITFTGSVDLDTELDHTDIIAYYELLDNSIVSLDLGINFKYGDYTVNMIGEVAANDQPIATLSSTEDYSGVIPMIYTLAEVGIPGTGLTLFGDLSFVKFDGDTAYDVQGGVKYRLIDNLAVDLDLQFGYRKILVDVRDLSDLYIDAEWDGYTAGVEVHF